MIKLKFILRIFNVLAVSLFILWNLPLIAFADSVSNTPENAVIYARNVLQNQFNAGTFQYYALMTYDSGRYGFFAWNDNSTFEFTNSESTNTNTTFRILDDFLYSNGNFTSGSYCQTYYQCKSVVDWYTTNWTSRNCQVLDGNGTLVLYGTEYSDFTSYGDYKELKKIENDMSVEMIIRPTNESLVYGWYYQTKKYYFDITATIGAQTYNVPIQTLPCYNVGIMSYDFGDTPVLPDSTWHTTMQWNVGKIYTNYFMNQYSAYSKSNGQNWVLNYDYTGVPLPPTTAPNGTPPIIQSETQNSYIWQYSTHLQDYPKLYAEQLYKYLNNHYNLNLSYNDFYNINFDWNIYDIDKQEFVSKFTFNWREYRDTNIVPPLTPTNVINIINPPDEQDPTATSDNGEIVGVPPIPHYDIKDIGDVQIEDYNFTSYTPDSDAVGALGTFYNIFINSPISIIIFVGLGLIIAQTLLWR